MIVFDAAKPLSSFARDLAKAKALELVAEHDGPYSEPWRSEKERRILAGAGRDGATLHNIAAWMDQPHRMRFLLRVGDYAADKAARDELVGLMWLRPEGAEGRARWLVGIGSWSSRWSLARSIPRRAVPSS